MTDQILVYGAYGFTGKLIVDELLKLGHRPVLSGRDEQKLKEYATSLDLPYKTVDIDDATTLEALLKKVKVVVHSAGPFVHTAKQMFNACLKTRTHYTDITGEIDIFEWMAAKDAEARKAGIVVLPGAGFDVVPTDCLAAHLHRRLPSATHLSLAFAPIGGNMSRGTAKTTAENLGRGGAIRKNGKITRVPTVYKVEEIQFDGATADAVTIPWGDVSTAYHSTKIPNIEVFMAVPPFLIKQMKWADRLSWLFKRRFVKNFLLKRIDKRVTGPDLEKRQRSKSFFRGEASDDKGNSVVSTQVCPEGYTLTAMTAADIAHRILNQPPPAGFYTPSKAFGADYILEFDGCSRKDQ